MALRLVVTFGPEAELFPEQDRPLAGIPTATLALCAALARRGHAVHLFARCPRPGQHDGLTFHDRAEFAGFAESHHADVLVAVPPFLPILMPLRARARVVWSGNAHQTGDCALSVPWSWAEDHGGEGRKARLYGMALLHPYADRIFVKSEWQARRMSEIYGLERDRFTVAYNGVPLEYYEGPPPPRDRYRLVYTSQARRGLHALLRLFPQIRAAVPEASLHIFLDERKAARGLPDLQELSQPGVYLRGRLSKSALAQELRSAALMAYPCRFKETFCTAVAEAQAAGLPVVTSDLAALAERVSHAVDGFLIPGRPGRDGYDPAFVEAVVRLLRDDDVWARMGAEAATKARDLYDWHTIAAGWEMELKRLVAGREALPPTVDPGLNLLDPSLLTVTARGVSASVPAALAEQWLREAWAEYGFEQAAIPGLPGLAVDAHRRPR